MANIKNDNEIYDKDYDEFYGKWSRVETYKNKNIETRGKWLNHNELVIMAIRSI